ncbi:MAG: helix-turn-helix domain-containing protein [Puniceicoccales bacterium]
MIYFEIITEGSVYGPEDSQQLYGEATVFCHRAGHSTIFRSPQNSYYHCVVPRFQMSSGADVMDWPRCFQWRDRKAMHQFTDEMIHSFHYAGMDSRVIGNLVWSRLCFELEQFRMHERGHGLNPQLSAATDFMNARYADPIGIEEVAEAAGVSVSHLHMLFRQHLDETPHQYLIQKRMRVAGHTLVTTDDPIKAIASDVGYLNTENFCRAFRKFFGKSASEYRQAYARPSRA